MTGLNLPTDALVEIAVLATDENLNPIGAGVEVVIKPPDAALIQMGDFVRQMHTDSGLLPLLASGKSLAEAEALLPRVNEYLHYRSVDVSSIKELAKRWYPKAYFAAPEKSGNHRALGDVRDSIAELAHYRASIFLNSSSE